MSNHKHSVEIIIETPKGSRNKYIWDEQRRMVRFKKSMPLGFIFPFDFGMVPGTEAEDGDPIDVLLLLEEPVYPGILIDVTVIGALTAAQQTRKKYRNDRIIAIESTCPVYGHYKDLEDISDLLRKQIEVFFSSYNQVQGKEFTTIEWVDAARAMTLIREGKKEKLANL